MILSKSEIAEITTALSYLRHHVHMQICSGSEFVTWNKAIDTLEALLDGAELGDLSCSTQQIVTKPFPTRD